MTEREKMLSGALYASEDPELAAARIRARTLCGRLNQTPPEEREAQEEIIRRLFASVGENSTVNPVFWCDYGSNITAGDNFYVNYNCVILDCAPVTFGDNVFIAPNCGFYTAGHPLDAPTRNAGLEYARPITVGSDVWFGGNVGTTRGDHRLRLGDRRGQRGHQGRAARGAGGGQPLPGDPPPGTGGGVSMPQHVRVVPPDPAWAEGYRRERALLMPVFGPLLVELHHIGSTAVEGLWAKPILDLMPVVTSLEAVDRLDPELEALGYQCMGEFGIPGRRYFRKGGDHRTHQLHVFQAGDRKNILRHLAVRDYLRACPAEREAYGALKRWLAGQYPEDIEGYCDGKDAFVRALERRALDWYDEKRP